MKECIAEHSSLCWKIKDGANCGFDLFDLADRLRVRGWQVPAYTLPPKCEHQAVQRIIVRHGFSRDLADLLLQNMKQAIGHFERHPVRKSLTPEEASGFNH
jgi:glutamate decarboxylase